MLAFADHGETGSPMSDDTTSADQLIEEFEKHNVKIKDLAAELQKQGAEGFNKSWNNLIKSIADKRTQL